MLNGKGGRVLFGVTPSGKIVGQEITDNTRSRTWPTRSANWSRPPRSSSARFPSGTSSRFSSWRRGLARQGRTPSTAGPTSESGRPTSRMPQPEYERLLLVRTHSVQRWESQPATGYTLDDLGHQGDRAYPALGGRGRSPGSNRHDAPAKPSTGCTCALAARSCGPLWSSSAGDSSPTTRSAACGWPGSRGTTKTEFLDQRQLEGHAFKLLKEADLFLKRHLPVAGSIRPDELERQDRPVYPAAGLAGGARQRSVPPGLRNRRRRGERRHLRRPPGDHQHGPPPGGYHRGRLEA